MSLQGEVPDEAGVRVIRWWAAVRSSHYILTAVATVHVTVTLHVVAVEHAWTHVTNGGVDVGMLLRLVPHHLVDRLCLSEAAV